MIDAALRMRVFAFVAIVLFGGLIARLWYLQGLESQQEELARRAETNVLEQVFEEAPRGRVLDRSGRVLVDNEVVEVVTIDRGVIEDLDDPERDDLFFQLAVAVSRSGRLTKVEDIVDQYNDRSYGPFERIPVAVDVNPELLVFLGERPDQFPGVEVVERTVRSYPYGSLAAHLLGYVGPITRDEWTTRNALIDADDEGAKTYQLNHEVGKTGVELVFENDLRGVPGTRFIEVNSAGEVVGERKDLAQDPEPGNDVWLSIDIDLQALAEAELRAGLDAARVRPPSDGDPPNVASAGSVVAMDPRNGELLAMASFPTYEPADFVNGISFTQFEELTSEENFSPILNRAIQGTYAPGSTFKLVTAVAAMEEGVIGTDPESIRGVGELYLDDGDYIYSNCFEESSTCLFGSPFTGERYVDMARAMTVSSDTYFYEIAGEGFWTRRGVDDDGLRLDEGIQKWARSFGFGTDSGLQVPYERSGVVPDRAYYDTTFGASWFAGATINLSIGQGELLVTPLQLANAYATFGNGGTLHQPNVATQITDPDGEVLVEFGPRVLRELEITPEHAEPLELGLLGVTMSNGGTAKRVFDEADFNVWNFPVAGKTGTAQVITQGIEKADTSLFAAYGPVYREGSGVPIDAEPDLAISVIMEESGFGSASAAPVAAEIFAAWATDSVPAVPSANEVTRVAAGALGDGQAQGAGR